MTGGDASVEDLLALLQRQREALLAGAAAGADGAAELERVDAELAIALAGFGSALGVATPGLPATKGSSATARARTTTRRPPPDAASIAAVREALRLNQSMIARLADVNRRTLNTLFGEPTLYGR